MIGQDATQQHTEQMEELCHRHQDVTGTNQVELCDYRMEIGSMLEMSTWDDIGLIG